MIKWGPIVAFCFATTTLVVLLMLVLIDDVGDLIWWMERVL